MSHALIIEDEPFIADYLRCLLEEEGVSTFDIAATEDAAVAAALAHAPDLITSDVKLIAGTGPRAVAEIYRRLGDIPVIFVTASPSECAPCDPPGRVLTKPIDAEKFTQAYHELTQT